MLEIEIKGLLGEGKTKTAIAIEDYWTDRGRKVLGVEGYTPGMPWEENLSGVDVLIKVIQ